MSAITGVSLPSSEELRALEVSELFPGISPLLVDACHQVGISTLTTSKAVRAIDGTKSSSRSYHQDVEKVVCFGSGLSDGDLTTTQVQTTDWLNRGRGYCEPIVGYHQIAYGHIGRYELRIKGERLPEFPHSTLWTFINLFKSLGGYTVILLSFRDVSASIDRSEVAFLRGAPEDMDPSLLKNFARLGIYLVGTNKLLESTVTGFGKRYIGDRILSWRMRGHCPEGMDYEVRSSGSRLSPEQITVIRRSAQLFLDKLKKNKDPAVAIVTYP